MLIMTGLLNDNFYHNSLVVYQLKLYNHIRMYITFMITVCVKHHAGL